MLEDINSQKRKNQKFRRGLSIYEDPDLKHNLTTETAAPLLHDQVLSQNLQQVLFSKMNLQEGPQKSIVQNQETDYASELTVGDVLTGF